MPLPDRRQRILPLEQTFSGLESIVTKEAVKIYRIRDEIMCCVNKGYKPKDDTRVRVGEFVVRCGKLLAIETTTGLLLV